MKKKLLSCILALASSIALVACDNDDNNDKTSNTPVKDGAVVTGDAYNVSQDVIAVQCSISQDAIGNNEIMSAGVIYQQANSFSDINGAEAELVYSATNNNRIARVENPSVGDYRIELTDFVYGDYEYYYRAFFVTNNTFYYGKVKSVRTPSWNLNLCVGDVTELKHNSAIINDLSFNSTTLEQNNCHYSFGIAYMSKSDFSTAAETAKSSIDVWNKAKKLELGKNENKTIKECPIDGLKPNTNYYYCPYVNVFNQTCYYGDNTVFKTIDVKIDTLIAGRVFYSSNSLRIIENRVNSNMLTKKDNYTLGVEVLCLSDKNSKAIESESENASLGKDFEVEIKDLLPGEYQYRTFIKVYDIVRYSEPEKVTISYYFN